MFEEEIAAVNKMIEEEKDNVPTCQKPQKRTYTVDEIMDIWLALLLRSVIRRGLV